MPKIKWPDGNEVDLTADVVESFRKMFQAGKYPPAPNGWTKETWETGCLAALDPPKGDRQPMLADRLLTSCDRDIGDYEVQEMGPDHRFRIVPGNGPHPWGSEVRIRIQNPPHPPGLKPCYCGKIRSLLESAIRVHPSIDGCLRINQDSPLLRQVGRNTVIRVNDAET